MPLLPPDLTSPFRTPSERAGARQRLRLREELLVRLEALAATPAQNWSPAERQALPSTTNGVVEGAPARLSRWAVLFADELAEVHRIAEPQRVLGDVELKEALYLAGRLLATATDRSIDSIDAFQLPRAVS